MKIEILAAFMKRFKRVDKTLKKLHEGQEERILPVLKDIKTLQNIYAELSNTLKNCEKEFVKLGDKIPKDTSNHYNNALKCINNEISELSKSNKRLEDKIPPNMNSHYANALRCMDGKISELSKSNKKFQDCEDGKDGRGVEKLFINPKGHLIIIYTDKKRVDLGLMKFEKVDERGGGVGVSYHAGTGISIRGTAISIADDYEGQTSITKLGTITTGTWNGDKIEIAYGGTGQVTQQAAINALTNASAASTGEVVTKLSNGNAVFTALEVGNITQDFTNVSSVSVTHNFGCFPSVTILDNTGLPANERIPFTIKHNSTASFTVTFSSNQTGKIVANCGNPGSGRDLLLGYSIAPTGLKDPSDGTGLVSINIDPAKLDISATTGVFTDVENLTITEVSFAGVSAHTPLNFGTGSPTFYYFDNTGTLVERSIIEVGEFSRNHPMLGISTDDSGAITGATSYSLVSRLSGSGALHDIMNSTQFVRRSGMFVSDGGITASRLAVDMSAGACLIPSIQSRTNVVDPHSGVFTAITGGLIFETWRSDGTNGETLILQNSGVLIGVYDDGTAISTDTTPQGTLLPNRWAVHHILFIADFGILAVQYGQIAYNSESEAIEGIRGDFYETLPGLSSTIPLGVLVVGGSGATVSSRATTRTGDFI